MRMTITVIVIIDVSTDCMILNILIDTRYSMQLLEKLLKRAYITKDSGS